MAFLKKKSTSGGHSRSGSASSILNKHVDPANISEFYPSVSEHKTTTGLKNDYTLDSSSKSSRKSSGGSTNSLTSEKLLFNWDVTDPSQWTMPRIIQWFRSNDFNEQWINFFKRNSISGNKFLKLLAYDNFAPYEKNLTHSKTSCYERFQYLLKKTLEENVVKGNNRNGNRIINNSRSSSESAKINQRLPKSFSTHIRSTSESALLGNKAADSVAEQQQNGGDANGHKKHNSNEHNVPLRHTKTNSASALYRRSLISLRNSSTTKEPTVKNDIKITIPPRPFSSIENNSSKSPPVPAPVSPSHSAYSGIFKRQLKSSSSESSLFNAIFGHAPPEESVENTETTTPKVQENKRTSIPPMAYSSPLKLNPYTADEKATLWDKIKRKGPPTEESPTYTSSNPIIEEGRESSTPSPNTVQISEDMYPKKASNSTALFILITKDNSTFSPFNIRPFLQKDVHEFKRALALALGITHLNFTVHLTDFGAEYGSKIPDNLLEMLQKVSFHNVPKKLYIKDMEKIVPTRARTETLNSQHSVAASSISKSSVKSGASNTSTGEGSSSDLTSIDDQSSSHRRTYPHTPSHYYDNNASSEADYWSFKDATPELAPDPVPAILPKSRPSIKLNSAAVNTSSSQKSTFRIIRKASDTDIDFNKRRESPYARVPELAPKRKAPKPPISSSTSTVNIPTTTNEQSPQTEIPSTTKLELNSDSLKLKKKQRPPPPITTYLNTRLSVSSSSSKDQEDLKVSPVQPFTPASTQVMIPQPYKGALETLKTRKSSSDLAVRPRMSMKRFSRSNSSVNRNVLSSSRQSINRTNSKTLINSSTAADVFDENEISFADAPGLSDSDDHSMSSDEIIWSKNEKSSPKNDVPEFSFNGEESVDMVGSDTTQVSTGENTNTLTPKKMALRPSPDVVYQNLEKFFPDADLDNPILEGLTPPSSPNVEKSPSNSKEFGVAKAKQEQNPPFLSTREDSSQFLTPVSTLKPPRRTKTIRIIAQEASEARKNDVSMKLKRKNTKMWGTKVVEITDKRTISINKARNSKGEYKEFAWIKGEIIGKGSFGAVYLALNVTTGEMMAVKQVTVPQFSSQDESVISMVEALKSEVSTLKDLNHLNIVQYLGFEEKEGIYSLFLEYVAGGSVGSLIRMYGRFDDQLIRHLTVQVLRGLAYLHSTGILHRDMKADNLLLDNDGVCKISDFGISRKSNNIYSNSDMTMRGTVFWMAPEMVDTAHGYSAKVDIWSLGCVVLEMYAGKRPWSNFEVVAAMFQIGKSKTAPPIPDDTKDLISASGKNFLDMCFEINPEKRPTADFLVSHPFCKTDPSFDFSKTKLAQFIRSNDKLNNSKLRISSQEL